MANAYDVRPGADLWDAEEVKGKAGMREYIESIQVWCPSKAPGTRKVCVVHPQLLCILFDTFYSMITLPFDGSKSLAEHSKDGNLWAARTKIES
jgi:hypothetical protein